QAGCDHVLNSKARNDKQLQADRGFGNIWRNTPRGYNTVVRIPAGATNIDIKQVSYSGKPEDDNYL
ncbi:hypothetical protein CRUP_028627, partial [Coryphaenoides rupestris]